MLDKTKCWQTVCQRHDLVNNSGVCALIENDRDDVQQVAIFHLPDTQQKVFAIGNYDPVGKANVLSRGIVGSVGDEVVVASPLYKQHFSLSTGKCLQADASATVYAVRIINEQVQLLV